MYACPFIGASVASVRLRLPGPAFAGRDGDARGPTLWTHCMIEIGLQHVHDVTGFRVVVPEHAEVSNANRRHQGTDHLVELACRCPKNPSEGRVSHIQEWVYRRFNRRVSSSLILRFALGHALETPLYPMLRWPHAKAGVSMKNCSGAQCNPERVRA